MHFIINNKINRKRWIPLKIDDHKDAQYWIDRPIEIK